MRKWPIPTSRALPAAFFGLAYMELRIFGKHAGRHAACKTGACTWALSYLRAWDGQIRSHCRALMLASSRKDSFIPPKVATSPCARSSVSVRGATEPERVDPSPGALGRPAVFSMENAQKHLAGCW